MLQLGCYHVFIHSYQYLTSHLIYSLMIYYLYVGNSCKNKFNKSKFNEMLLFFYSINAQVMPSFD